MAQAVVKRKPKILLWDIETLPMQVFSWGLYNQNHSHEDIIENMSLICASWKWFGESKVHSVSILDDRKAFNKDPYDDKVVVKKLYDTLLEADIVIAHNGDAFDLKSFETRSLFHGLNPLPPKKSVDTLKQAKAYFRFPSNKLDYIASFLGFEGKDKMGMQDWRDIARGKIKAVEKMVRYNKKDVKVLENVYLRLRPWMRRHPNLNLYLGEEICACPVCASTNLRYKGKKKQPKSYNYYTTRTSKYKQYQCKDCGHWLHEGKAEKRETGPVLR